VDTVGHCLVEADDDLGVLVDGNFAHRLESLNDHPDLLRYVQSNIVPVESFQKLRKLFADLLALGTGSSYRLFARTQLCLLC